jgi:excisionase family DNA binding protein
LGQALASVLTGKRSIASPLVLGVEMSRLARSCRDWHQLLEICALFDTLIADVDGVYDPTNYNDRLLLGLKGTMSEAELHILKARMLEGRRAKARRGELGKAVPMGYLRRASGEVVLDPDQQAQATIRLVFDLFERLRTIGKVLRYLVAHDIRLPVRARSGVQKDELEWRRPSRATLQNLFANPTYAGAYVYGVRSIDRRRQKAGRPGTGRRSLRAEEAEVFLPDRMPAYITWDQYQRNQAQLQSNRAAWGGAPRSGSALLSGAITCGRCGLQMSAHYNNNGYTARYVCLSMKSNYGEPFCQSLTAAPLDALMTRLVLQALEPAALEASLALATDLEAERAVHSTEQVRVICHWHGGNRTLHQLMRPVARLTALSTYNSLVERAADLRRAGHSSAEIAETLNLEGWRPAKRRNTFNRPMVHHLLIKAGVIKPKYRRRKTQIARQPNEWTIRELAEQIGVPESTLYTWVRKGHLRSRIMKAGRTILVHADPAAIAELKAIRATPAQ